MIADAVAGIRGAAANKALTVDVRLPDELLLQADPGRLRQVADNLLSNAVKYTPHGGTITVTADQHDDAIIWSVADTGIGVPARTNGLGCSAASTEPRPPWPGTSPAPASG